MPQGLCTMSSCGESSDARLWRMRTIAARLWSAEGGWRARARRPSLPGPYCPIPPICSGAVARTGYQKGQGWQPSLNAPVSRLGSVRKSHGAGVGGGRCRSSAPRSHTNWWQTSDFLWLRSPGSEG